MSDKTGIEWTDATWNPVTGCSKVSAGCKHCYAERDWSRLQHLPAYKGRAFTDVVCHPERLDQPLRWAKPRRIFVNSMSDLFHPDVPDEFIDKVFAVMALTPRHTFQILTKRPERMREYMNDASTPGRVDLLKHVIEAGRLEELSAQERVADVIGWPGYFVTSKGRVLSDRTKAGSKAIGEIHEMKAQQGDQGHARVMVQFDGRKERLLVHRLVLEHFDRTAIGKEQGCHIDGNPTNNALWNLRWGDQSANRDDSNRHGTRRRYSKLTEGDVATIKTRLAAGDSAYSIAPEFGVSDTQIRNIAKGKQWQPEYKPEWPLGSVWLGVSVEDQATADERIPLLLQTPAAVRFISAEPLFGPIRLDCLGADKPYYIDALRGEMRSTAPISLDPSPQEELPRLDWVVVGGESGPKARPMVLGWAKEIVIQCRGAGVPVLMKQVGANPTNREGQPHKISDRKGSIVNVFSADNDVAQIIMMACDAVEKATGEKA